jgi:hypothetical protein
MTFDKEELSKLKKARGKAIEDGEESFTFNGELILVQYAKYLIEYLEKHFKGEYDEINTKEA